MFHQKFPLLSSDLKNAFTKHFPKMQPFANVLQNRCYYNFVLEPLFNKVTGLMACNFIKKRPQHRCFPVNITKYLRKAFFMEHLRWLFLKMFEEFLRISKGGLTRNDLYDSKNSLWIAKSWQPLPLKFLWYDF